MDAWLVALSLWVGEAPEPQSAAARKAAREIAEAFGREALEHAEPRIARLIEAFGDDAVRALRRAGPAAVPLLEKYGAAGVRVLGKWGDDGLRLLAAEGDEAVEALARYGDGAVEFMVRHPGVGKDLIRHFGADALRAQASTEGVILLNRLAEPIRASGRAQELLRVVERFGDRACQFLWRNKGTVFAAALLAAFLADPKPYIEGLKELVVEPASSAAQEAVRRTDWTPVVLAAVILAMAPWLIRSLRKSFRRPPASLPSA
jgi:hypothetical protein